MLIERIMGMAFDLDQIKASAVPIEQVINEDEGLEQKRGRYLRGVQHDSLVVDVHGQMYHWNSRDEWGDVIEWLGKHRGLDFREAVEYLCERGGMPAPEWGQDALQAAVARKRADVLTIACRHWVKALRGCPGALEYARWRGWSEETIRQAGLGYVDGDRRALEGELRMHEVELSSDAARAVLSTPKGMLVYPCVRGGRVVYYLCRSASRDTKEHWNPPVDLVGARQRYLNWEYSGFADLVVVVEGPADAITLAEWGVASVALAGTGLAPDELDGLVRMLARHDTVVIGLDQGAKVATLADALGPMARVVEWPAKDVNEWLQEGGTGEDCQGLIDGAATWVEMVTRDCGDVHGVDRPKAMDRAFGLIARMGDFDRQMLRAELVDALGINVRMFNALVKAKRGEVEEEERGSSAAPEIQVEIPGGWLGEHLLEMLVIPPEERRNGHGPGMWRTKFACRFPDGKIKVVDWLDLEGEGGRVRYLPIPASNRVLTERVVLFPSELPGEALSLRDLVRWVQRLVRKYVDVDAFYETLAAYYVLFSWLYDCFNTVPYLRMLGDAGTGKSRFIQVVGAMAYRPTFVTGAATTSPIFRMLDRYRGTLILDEADYRSSDEAADIVKILNTGYQRTQGVVLRSGDKNVGFDTEVFVVYGPKVIATRKRFRDWALESRCLTHEAGGPTTRTDIPIDLPLSFWTEEVLPIRNALLRYRMEYWKPEIELDYGQMDVSVEPRLNQVTVALQTLIDDMELQDDLRGFIKEYNRQLIVERGATLTARVLEALVGLYWMDIEDHRVPPNLTVKRVSKATNVVIDFENEEGQTDEEEEGGGQQALRVKPKKVGEVVRKQLHLRTKRRADAGRAYCVQWDEARIEAMRKRFGVDKEALTQIIQVLRAGMGEELEGEQGELLLDA
jgi:hypothetical protein